MCVMKYSITTKKFVYSIMAGLVLSINSSLVTAEEFCIDLSVLNSSNFYKAGDTVRTNEARLKVKNLLDVYGNNDSFSRQIITHSQSGSSGGIQYMYIKDLKILIVPNQPVTGVSIAVKQYAPIGTELAMAI